MEGEAGKVDALSGLEVESPRTIFVLRELTDHPSFDPEKDRLYSHLLPMLHPLFILLSDSRMNLLAVNVNPRSVQYLPRQ